LKTRRHRQVNIGGHMETKDRPQKASTVQVVNNN
jgi:hypothetical protein